MADTPLDPAVPAPDLATLDERVRRAEEAVMRRDERMRRQLSEASLHGQRLVHGSGKWFLTGAGVLGAAWLALRRKSSRPRPGLHGVAASTAKSAQTAKSAGKLGMLGAIVSLVSTVISAANGAQRLGIPWATWGRDALGAVRRRPAPRPVGAVPMPPSAPPVSAGFKR